jgi:hypothetical protein
MDRSEKEKQKEQDVQKKCQQIKEGKKIGGGLPGGKKHQKEGRDQARLGKKVGETRPFYFEKVAENLI